MTPPTCHRIPDFDPTPCGKPATHYADFPNGYDPYPHVDRWYYCAEHACIEPAARPLP